MRLSKAGYFADFFIYPPIVLVLAAGAAVWATSLSWLYWVLACLCGIAAWTLAEYVIHRVVLHHVRMFAEMHEMHHDNPTDLVGSPTWLSLATICFGVMLPLWWGTSFEVAGGLTAGLMIGYLWYVTVHHLIHHRKPEPSTYLYHAKRRHALHHHAVPHCNFGVTTGFWDRVFGTASQTR